ncbi:hypothetical protein J6590_087454 [Homalodisca vitripennis]|nr:hypothetical protein J6590_087454 [Homalodisca vitripennis]
MRRGKVPGLEMCLALARGTKGRQPLNVRKRNKKVTESKRSGAGTDAVHVPKLWYYKLLLFLSDQEEVRLSITSLDSLTEDSQQTGAGHADNDVLSECEEDEKEQSQPETSTPSTSSAPTFGRKKRARGDTSTSTAADYLRLDAHMRI